MISIKYNPERMTTPMNPPQFNPGCALSLYKPDMEQKILHHLNTYYNNNVKVHKICCRFNPKVKNGSIIINVCAGCDRRFRSLYEGVGTISLWEVLAIRSLLKKMNIEVIETEHHGTKSRCCCDDFYEKIPLEQVHEKMKERADSMPCDDVVVYCVSCIKAMFIGGKKARYMVDLLFNEETTPEVYDTVEWHNQLREYIENHKG